MLEILLAQISITEYLVLKSNLPKEIKKRSSRQVFIILHHRNITHTLIFVCYISMFTRNHETKVCINSCINQKKLSISFRSTRSPFIKHYSSLNCFSGKNMRRLVSQMKTGVSQMLLQ